MEAKRWCGAGACAARLKRVEGAPRLQQAGDPSRAKAYRSPASSRVETPLWPALSAVQTSSRVLPHVLRPKAHCGAVRACPRMFGDDMPRCRRRGVGRYAEMNARASVLLVEGEVYIFMPPRSVKSRQVRMPRTPAPGTRGTATFSVTACLPC